MTWIVCLAVDGTTEVLVNMASVAAVLPNQNTILTYDTGHREVLHGSEYERLKSLLKPAPRPIAKARKRK